jgi:hypothetical protein
MATLPDRVARLEEVIGSSATGALVARVVHLEVCCLGSAAAGPLLQRISKLEELIGCDPGTAPVAPIAAPVAPVTPVAAVAVAAVAAVAAGPAEVADAAASNQVRCSCFATGIHFKPGTQIQCLSKLHEVISLLS